MRLSNRSWYVLFAVIALAPIGLRMLTWQSSADTPVDPTMAAAGQVLFVHEWKPHDPLANGGDGLGPVFNAKSCVACHQQGGPGGAGDLAHNVTLFTIRADTPDGKPREGVVHAGSVRAADQETLSMVDASLPAVARPALSTIVRLPGQHGKCLSMPSRVQISQRNTPALFGAKLIDQLPERLIIANARSEKLRWGMPKNRTLEVPVGRALRLPNAHLGRFGWKAQASSLSDFVQAACANELGLGNPGQAQPAPLNRSSYRAQSLDLTLEQCDQLTSFVASLPRPVERLPDDPKQREQAVAGKKVFSSVGCADCHQANIGSVEGIYSDLLLHSMGRELQATGSYNEPPQRTPDGEPPDDVPAPDEWRTPPLWGVADSAPYMHDGRAASLPEAIEAHGGQATRAVRAYQKLGPEERVQLIAFLLTLRAP